MSQKDEFELVRGSGNVFRDLGEKDADVKKAKARLARVRNANLTRFTLYRLIKMLSALDDSIEGILNDEI